MEIHAAPSGDNHSPGRVARPKRKRYRLRMIRRRAESDPPPPPLIQAAHLEAIAHERFGVSRGEMIAQAAYYRAQGQQFRGGDSVRDWHEAEAEIDAMLLSADAEGDWKRRECEVEELLREVSVEPD